MQLYQGQAKKLTDCHTVYDFAKKEYRKDSEHILTLDIETTSAWILDDGTITTYKTGQTAEYWSEQTPVAIPYIWQFSIDDKVYYGREWADFRKVLQDLPKTIHFIIWVHNLAFEFEFLTNLLTFKNVFARNPHKVMYATAEEFPNVEFRCSYFLTRLSLADWGEELGLEKMVGDLDYEKMRTPKTKLTAKELKYCERDCEVVYKGIKQFQEKYKTLKNIPLTQTGTVRREIKKLLMKEPDYAKFIKKLVPANAQQYKDLQTVFSGGYTHANRKYSGITQVGLIEHYDFASSYPAQMCAKKYPMTPWVWCFDSNIPNDFDDYAYIMKLKFKNIKCMKYNTYIQISKCDGENIIADNGRVLSADELTILICEQDYEIIKNVYKWENVEILEMRRSKKEYLPKPLIEYILELYENKTKLKGVEGQEALYTQSKQFINSLFGMCVTAVMQSDVLYDPKTDTWTMGQLTQQQIEETLQDLQVNRPENKKYFLNYSWGIYVAAYGRKALWDCILMDDKGTIYCDTDSIFCKGKHDFSTYNEKIVAELNAMCEHYGIDPERTRPKTNYGKQKQLGIFEKEDDCIEFKTLGAKRYVERRASDGKLHLTVAGINKEAVDCLEDNIDYFVENFEFDKDSGTIDENGKKHGAFKQLSTYCSNMPRVVFPDGYVSEFKHGINMRRTGYLLTIPDEYKEICDFTQFCEMLVDAPEQLEVAMRGFFCLKY